MHIESALISAAVAIGFTAVQTCATAVAVKKTVNKTTSTGIRRAAVAGALVFALQMLNFAIPGTGSSGHVVGAILLCILLGRWSAFLTMGAVLLVQSLFFGDGGLLAFSCNWFNMAFIPCLIVYPLAMRLFNGNTYRIALTAPVVSLLLGAFAASIEIGISGHSTLAFGDLIKSMLFIHLFIGIGEGLIIWGILKAMDMSRAINSELKTITMAIVVGCLFSLFASASPDGLEWSLMQAMSGSPSITEAGVAHQYFDKIQEALIIMPDYSFEMLGDQMGKSFSALTGVALVLVTIFSMLLFIPKDKLKIKA